MHVGRGRRADRPDARGHRPALDAPDGHAGRDLCRLLSARAPSSSRHRQVDGFADAREVVVRSVDGHPVPLQVDGDYIGDVTEAEYSVDEAPLFVVS